MRLNVQHRWVTDGGETANHRWLVEDLAAGELVLRSLPDEAHVQFSTYCNMSCVMCWNGANPPIRDMGVDVLDRLGEQFGSALEILIPHDGSEPTARRWSEACAFARTHGLRLHLTTNVQGLSERRLRDALDVVSSIHLSVDSHRPEVLEQIRPGARSRAIMRNLRRILAVADEHGIECEVFVVLLTLNADHVHESIEFFALAGARAVSVIRMLDVNGVSGDWDPVGQLGERGLERVHAACSNAAARHGLRLGWLVDDAAGRFEGVEVALEAPGREAVLAQIHHTNPGFCRFAFGGMRVTVDGDVTPCGYAGNDHLQLGNVCRQGAQEIWNGPTAQDLRRAMYSGDLPQPCDTCIQAQPRGPSQALPMFDMVPELDDAAGMRALGPTHLHRSEHAPLITITSSGVAPDQVMLHVAHGGGSDVLEMNVPQVRSFGRTAQYQVVEADWRRLEENQGYWWLLSVPGPTGHLVRVTDSAKCFIRHRELPRIRGSGLVYRDGGSAAGNVDLGVRLSLGPTRISRPSRATRTRKATEVFRRLAARSARHAAPGNHAALENEAEP